MLEQSGIKGLDSGVVGQPEFFRQVETSLRAHTLGEWKTYLRWQLVHTFAAQAGGRFDAENFHFFGTILNGTPEQRPRWKRMLDQEENYLGDALGQPSVQATFYRPPKNPSGNLTKTTSPPYRIGIAPPIGRT